MRKRQSVEQIRAAAHTDSPAPLQELYSALAPAVAGYLRSQGASDPDDITSEVFVGVFSGMRSFSGSEEEFRSWVFTIAHRRLVDDRRRRGRLRAMYGGDKAAVATHAVAGAGNVEEEVAAHLGCDRVRRLLARLSPDQRDVLTLRILGDLSVEQAAHALGKSEWAVKALQRRALASLRRLIAEEGVTA